MDSRDPQPLTDAQRARFEAAVERGLAMRRVRLYGNVPGRYDPGRVSEA